MASLPVSACCLNVVYHEGTPKGSFSTIAGLHTYSVGASHGNDKVVVILSDVFGQKLVNNLLIADQLSEQFKAHVVLPDLFNGGAVEDISKFDFKEFFGAYGAHVTTSLVNDFAKKLRDELSPTKVYGVGHCFGAKYVVQQLAKDKYFDAGAIAHPTGVDISEIEDLVNPILISTGIHDMAFTSELRNQTLEVLGKKEDLRFQVDIYSGAPHGFAVKGDISQPQVKYAKEKTLLDQVTFFKSI